MKLVVLFTFLVGFSVAQAQNSYYFSEAIPSNGSKITQVDKSLFGTYYNSDKGTSYEVSEEGIFSFPSPIRRSAKKQSEKVVPMMFAMDSCSEYLKMTLCRVFWRKEGTISEFATNNKL